MNGLLHRLITPTQLESTATDDDGPFLPLFWEQKWYSNASEVGFFLIPYHCHNRPMNVSLFAALRRRGTRLYGTRRLKPPAMATSTHKPPHAILPSLPEHLSGRLFAVATQHHLKAGEPLFVAGDAGDGCYRLERGLLKVVITSARGNERIVAIIGPGEVAGELAIIDGRPRSASVFAVRDCELSFISRKDFEEYTRQNPEICSYLVSVLAARLRETDEALAATSFLTVKARLARALLELAEFLGEDRGSGRILIHHKIKRSDLAAMAGVAPENVSRVMNDWLQHRVVTRSSGYYCLEDIATLKGQMRS